MRGVLAAALTLALMQAGTIGAPAQGLGAPEVDGVISPRPFGVVSEATVSGQGERMTNPPRSPAPGEVGPATGIVEPDAYIVGPGDVFQITLSGKVSRVDYVTVKPEGSILIPGWPPLSIAGQTLTEARRVVLKRLQRDLRDVNVDFQLSQVRYIRVQLTGDVRSPMPLIVPATSRVSDAVSDNNLLPLASKRRIEVRRRDGTHAVADLDLFMRTGRAPLNPYLRDGDVLYMPPATEFIEIYGAVAHPAQLELGIQDSLRTLLELAGNILPSARTDRALLVRWRTATDADSLWFRVDSVYAGVTNPPLMNGDRVYVQYIAAFHRLGQATISGEVLHPGVYPLTAGQTRLSDLVDAAGGFRVDANVTSIRVTRSPAWPASVDDPEIARLLKLSREQMTEMEYARLRTELATRRQELRIDGTLLPKHPDLNLILTSGDVIEVEAILSSVRVDGEVVRPGIVDYAPNRTLSEYIRLAGGFSQRAARARVMVMRSVTGQALPARDLKRIDSGDLIWVPDRPDRTLWQNTQTFIAFAASVATIIFVVRR